MFDRGFGLAWKHWSSNILIFAVWLIIQHYFLNKLHLPSNIFSPTKIDLLNCFEFSYSIQLDNKRVGLLG